MDAPRLGDPIGEDLLRKLRTLRDLVDAGAVRPDYLLVAWAAGVLKEAGERSLARDYERLARLLLPAFRRDLS